MTNKSSAKILKYWLRYMETDPQIKDWLDKENIYLRKNIKKGSVVLDVGCGFGRSIETIANIAKKIIGIDNNKDLFKNIKGKLLKFRNVEVFLEDAKKMHFAGNTFNYSICMGNTFGDLGKDKVEVLKEMKRVTKKGGKIIISVYSENALNIRVKGYNKIGIEIRKIQRGTIYTKEGLILEQFSKEKLEKIFNLTELKNIKIIKLNSISYLCEATIQ